MLLACVLCSLFVSIPDVHAQTTAFTCQGWLTDGRNPAGGGSDLRLALDDSASSGAHRASPSPTSKPSSASSRL